MSLPQPSPPIRWVAAVCWACLFLLGVAAPVRGAQQPTPPRPPERSGGLPQGLEIELLGGRLIVSEDGTHRFTGPVAIRWRDTRIQADRLSIREERYVEGEGNVLIVWGGNRVFGRRMTYDLETESGQFFDAAGQALDEYLFWAERIDKVGPDVIKLERATVTTCTQPTPYWSFAVSSATIRIDHYARMWNVRLRATKAPIFYLPYLIWPVKEGRAAGLLMPEFASTDTRGSVISQKLFIPLGRSADATLEGRYYTRSGMGGGARVRFIPNRQGSGEFDGFFINDAVVRRNRYRAAHRQTQTFRNGFRMVADINLVSDFNYFTDFERELNLVSSPTILTRLEFSRNGSWTSLNVREERREQLLSDGTSLIQQGLPEIEWRGRSRRLGTTPFYLSFESSVASIQQRGIQQGQPINADYYRADAFPTITLPWSPTAWLDVTPRVAYRLTHYTERQRKVNGTREIVGDGLTRRLWAYGLDIVGPKLYRIYEGRRGARYKHAFETRLSYASEDSFDRSEEIIVYDSDVDGAVAGGENVAYALVQRLFARRPRSGAEPNTTDATSVVLPDGTVHTPEDAAPTKPDVEVEEPVEIASLELRQGRSLDTDVSRADFDGDGTFDATSMSGPIQLIARFNPRPALSLDLRSSYDILFDRFSDLTASGGWQNRAARLRFSLVHRNGLGINPSTGLTREDSTQIRLTTGVGLLDRRLLLDVDGTYDANPGPLASHVPDVRWRVQYATQCCTFLFERLTRQFPGIEDRRDFYFRIDLRGVGKILDLNY